MVKRKEFHTIIGGIIVISILIFAANYFQIFEGNSWKPPKFVKEWEIREIKPGAKQEIVSLTANKFGIFALIKATEKTMLQKPDKLEEMSEKDKNEFLFKYSPFSAEALLNMSAEEKNNLFDFMIKHLIPVRKIKEISEAEKQQIMNSLLQYKEKEPEINRNLFRMNLQKFGRDKIIDSIMDAISSQETEEIYHFRIQHYDFEGIFINQWLEDNYIGQTKSIINNSESMIIEKSNQDLIEKLDSKEKVINPLFISSDEIGNIYIADYDGNKIIKFNQYGNILNSWKISDKKEIGLGDHKGFTIINDKIYLIFAFSYNTPKILIFDLNGRLIKEQLIKPPQIASRLPEVGTKLPFIKENSYVLALEADKEGEIFLFAPDATIEILDSNGREQGYIHAVLRKGFIKPKSVYDPEFKKEINYAKKLHERYIINFHSFNTDVLSNQAGECVYYCTKNIKLSPNGELFVTFIGAKTFGTINSLIFNTNGKMIGYWKDENKSYSPWFQKLSDVQKMETADIQFNIAFYQNIIITGRTFHIGRTRNQYKNIMQKFIREDSK